MQPIEIGPRGRYLHYVHLPSSHNVIAWSFSTHKKSIGFGLFRQISNQPAVHPSVNSTDLGLAPTPKEGSPSAPDKFSDISTGSEGFLSQPKLAGESPNPYESNLSPTKDGAGSGTPRATPVSRLNEIIPIRCYDAHKVEIRGEYKVDEPGTYILYFDNSHARSTSKRLTFFISTFKDADRATPVRPAISGWVLKKKRKRMQGWAKRWCSVKDGTLSYAKDENSVVRGSIQIPHSVATFDYSFLTESDFQTWESIILFYLQHGSDPADSQPLSELEPHEDEAQLPVISRSLSRRRSILTKDCNHTGVTISAMGIHFGLAEKKLSELFSNLDQLIGQLESYLPCSDEPSELCKGEPPKDKDPRRKYISFRSKKDATKMDGSPNSSSPTVGPDAVESIRTKLHNLQSQRSEVLQLLREESIHKQKLEAAYSTAVADLNKLNSSLKKATLDPTPTSESVVSFQLHSEPPPIRRHIKRRSVYSRRQNSILSISTIGNDESLDALEVLEIAHSTNSSDRDSEDAPNELCDESDHSDMGVNPPNHRLELTPITPQTKLELGKGPASRRTELPSPVCGVDDLATVSLPISLNEPLNILQRLAEELEYSELLDRANHSDDSMERLVHVAAFALSSYAAPAHRASRKPFNPLLGETYECVRPDKGFRFLAEKVSHTPPIFACHAESENFTFWQDSKPKSKFWGKSMELVAAGTVHVLLHAPNEHFTFNKAVGCMRNLVTGSRYLEYSGEVVVTNRSTGEYCKLTFKESSFFVSSNNEVKASLHDSTGRVVHTLEGQWNTLITWKKQPPEVVWKPNPLPPNASKMYSFTRFAMELNEITPDLVGHLPSTDTRLRPDQSLFEHGKVGEAEQEKVRLEEGQRTRRRERESLGQAYTPTWFHLGPQVDHEGNPGDAWLYGGGYWEARAARDFGAVPELW
ncbi:Oxysterol-binding protein 3 [Massospora cicadina]|nr:Oxysterol-binding protein 3 [Massospora cicadina]